MSEETRVCKECGSEKPLCEFKRTSNKSKSGERWYLHTCIKCASAKVKATYHADPRARALQIARSMNAHPRVRPARVDAHAIADMILTATHCAYCHQPNDGTVTFAVDHELPIALGGPHTLENLTTCCEPCNRAKHDMHPDDYRAWLRGVIHCAS